MEGDLRQFVDSLQVLALLDPLGLDSVEALAYDLLDAHYRAHPDDRPDGWNS